MINEYEHTQPGTLMRVVLGGFTVFFGCVALGMVGSEASEARIPMVLALGVLVVCLFLFHSLTVAVSPDYIRLMFGIGLIRKSFAMADVQDAAVVRNHWFYGWGIRLTFHGWLFNVSGFDAVEIRMKNGRKYRIGTDEPEALLAAIHAVIRR